MGSMWTCNLGLQLGVVEWIPTRLQHTLRIMLQPPTILGGRLGGLKFLITFIILYPLSSLFFLPWFWGAKFLITFTLFYPLFFLLPFCTINLRRQQWQLARDGGDSNDGDFELESVHHKRYFCLHSIVTAESIDRYVQCNKFDLLSNMYLRRVILIRSHLHYAIYTTSV